NDISKLPPEILRKGRFDEIFFVDLPSLDDRKDIFDISFKKYNRDPSDFNVIKLANLTKAFTGAEIEASIVSAMHEAFSEGREVSTDDVISSIDEIVPLSVTMEERISALREWA
ncbi:AAA family ATPase, partial [Escherichia coli]